ncbi:uncharacterized protein G2W53_007228 [Senna tora]|uniref:Uncharacterized protein n=1 Tax=Senna tora TaxID=362788 RepID=A0A834X5S2_9FABA|nr:uncharacterized protein G2W53_007228 [Senna tora]
MGGRRTKESQVQTHLWTGGSEGLSLIGGNFVGHVEDD